MNKKREYERAARLLLIEKQNEIKNNIKNLIINKNNEINVNNNLPIIKNQILYTFKNIENYIYGDNNKNTVLLIEPRFKEEVKYILANTYNKLGNDWNYVFYCGKSFKSDWENILPNFIELRPLDNDNFESTRLYSDFCKKKELWESLYGDYVLTIQLDTWIMNIDPYNISFFINLNKSFIGGNMDYNWLYFKNIDLFQNTRNFNGGLSLRKRLDMLKVIESYPPAITLDDRTSFESEHEDVYFVYGCILLNLPIGDDENSSHFSLHTIYFDKYFGIHQPYDNIKKNINVSKPYLKYLNPHLKL
jgi:hypothetical protein